MKKSFSSLWQGDLHLHTNLSFCAPAETLPDDYLPYCDEENVRVLGISNHLYKSDMLEAEGMPERRGADYAKRILPRLDALRQQTDIKILFGCEVEIFAGQEPTLSREETKQFDYMLIAASHICNVIDEYKDFDLSTPDKLRELLIDRFRYACLLDYPVPTAICHPLYPICSPWEQEVVDGISDSTLADCFSLAAAHNVAIEIHACLYRKGTALDEEGLSSSYLRLLSAAKACGCRFYFGSDAHTAEAFRGVHALLHRAAERAGITSDDMWQFLDE